ncbi:MAG: alkaline phosphatase family protein [Candidatus Thorarchaeota archaeon]|jgi:predicted AlkP superfamily pyrophosphatase or phosphodiesterase
MQVKPDYSGKGIVNLMSSIASAVGSDSPYPVLKDDIAADVEGSKNIVLMIVDGLGFDYLSEHGKNTNLKSFTKDAVTSVFPPSTGSAITTFITGLPPQQHAVTGWYVFLKEYGLMSRILPFTSVADWNVLESDIAHVIDVESLFWKMQRQRTIIVGEQIVDSVFSKQTIGNARRLGYQDLQSFFQTIENTLEQSREPSYIYSYWPELDSIAHILGIRSEEAQGHLQEFDQSLGIFIESIQGTDTTLIITSDHGIHDVDRKNLIITSQHPDLLDCLTLPLCGDTRSAYCYVRPSKVSKFERYVGSELGDACDLHKSDSLIDENWFGLFEPHPKLSSRVGDYTMIFKDGYAILNEFPGQEPPALLGHHGGTSKEEMNVPLIVINR